MRTTIIALAMLSLISFRASAEEKYTEKQYQEIRQAFILYHTEILGCVTARDLVREAREKAHLPKQSEPPPLTQPLLRACYHLLDNPKVGDKGNGPVMRFIEIMACVGKGLLPSEDCSLARSAIAKE